jgi:hypothetical protein
MIKSYRGLLDDEGQDRIRLGTPNGKMGYRIGKFEVISKTPGATADESVLKIYKLKQTAVDATIDFSDSTLIGCGYWSGATSSGSPATMNIIFENEVFNQDIYITHKNASGATPGDTACNYYLEMEQVKLTEQEALVSIVKNLRTEQ